MNHTADRPRFFGTSLLYFGGTLFSKLAVFLLLPLYTAKIPAGELGDMDAAIALAVFAASVLLLDVGVAILRFYLQANEKEQGRVLATGLCLMGALALQYLLFALVLRLFFNVRYFWLIVLYGLSNVLLLAVGHMARALGARIRYVLSGLLAALLQVSLAPVLVLLLDRGVQGLYIAYIVGALCGVLTVLLSPTLWRALRGARPSGRLLRQMLGFALPLGASAAAYLLLSSLLRVVARVHFGSEAAGHLAVALKLSQIILLVSTCFQLVWQELAFAVEATEDTAYYSARVDVFLRVATAAFSVLLPLTALLFALFPRFLGTEYAAAAGLLPPALLFAFFTVIATFLEPILAGCGQTGRLLLTTLAGSLVNVLLTVSVLLLGGGLYWLPLVGAFSFLTVALLRILLLTRAGVLRLSVRHALLLIPVLAVMGAYYLLSVPLQAAVLGLALLFAMAILLPEILLLFGRLFFGHT